MARVGDNVKEAAANVAAAADNAFGKVVSFFKQKAAGFEGDKHGLAAGGQ